MTTNQDPADGGAVLAACARRRRTLADFADGLTEQQLAVQSMCSCWDVRTVVGHLVVPLVVGTRRMAMAMLRHGGFHRANDALARAQARRPMAELTALLREHADSSFTPPGQGPAAPFTDLCVHTADMRVPLGLGHGIDPDEARIGLDLVTRSGRFLVARGLLAGVRLVPDDLDQTWGRGAAVHGNAADLLLAVLGRVLFVERLTGAGAQVLTDRLVR